jgi:predicted dehydrogenase
MDKLRVGVVGYGLIAQVMHLNYLRELSDRYEIVALCDLDESVRESVRPGLRGQEDLRELAGAAEREARCRAGPDPRQPCAIAIAAAERGIHVLVEKPMCFSVAEEEEMIAAAERAGVT